jgi:putative tryptophan/tyrosine transport system substrate-binding protein
VPPYPGLAAELVSLKVDLIVTTGPPAARAAKEATMTIPIVAMAAGDLLRDWLVPSLFHPGGNITGLSFFAGQEIGGKYLQFCLSG